MAEWLTSKHMTRAIDAYSIESTEAMLAESGFVPRRPGGQPAVAFADLTGFAALTQERGDAKAAEVALKLAELATDTAARHEAASSSCWATAC